MNYNQTSVYPTLPDDLIFFQDPDIEIAPLLQQYYEYINNNEFEEAADYLNRTDLHFYGAGLLNMIENRLLKTEQYCPQYVGTKADIHVYSETEPSDLSAPYKISWVGANEIVTPPSGNRFIEKSKVIEWLDEIPTGGIQAFNAHMGVDIIPSRQYVGWNAWQWRMNGRFYAAKRELYLNSITFNDIHTSTDVIIALPSLSGANGITRTPAYLAPFGTYSNIPIWIPFDLNLNDLFSDITYYNINYDYEVKVGTGSYKDYDQLVNTTSNVNSAGAALCCREHYEDKNYPNTNIEVNEYDCLIKFVGFNPGAAVTAYKNAMDAYVADPTPANKQAVITALQASVNP